MAECTWFWMFLYPVYAVQTHCSARTHNQIFQSAELQGGLEIHILNLWAYCIVLQHLGSTNTVLLCSGAGCLVSAVLSSVACQQGDHGFESHSGKVWVEFVSE